VGGREAIANGTVAIEGYFHFKTCRFCVKNLFPSPLVTVMAKKIFMYRRPILCTLYGALDFTKCSEEGLLVGEGGGVVIVT
jgi:hypothetical protein